jgi:hypothetical protein
MKFYKITTTHTQDYINSIIKKMSSTETDYISNLYSQIPMVEYTDDEDFECMFVILDDYLLNKLRDLYNKYYIKFEIHDLTKDIILDKRFSINFENCYGRSVQLEIASLIKYFKKNWISKDDILDKILEKGIKSLTDFDLDILNS